jgi:hypothetical protein
MKSVATVVCFVFVLFFTLPSAHAQQTIALHPLKGDSPEVAGRFFDEIVQALSEYPGPYIPYLINLEDDETVDVSSGGLPAYICPQPILTKDAPYAITGEVIQISDSFYTIRLYLWNMTSRVTLISDELIVDAEDETKYLPQLLSWMLSWIDREKPVTPDKVAEPEYWLSFGLRIGGGDSTWHYNVFDDNYIKREYVTHLLSGNFALQGSVHLLSWLAIQAEVNLCVDLSQPWKTDAAEGTFSSAYLTIPILFKFNWHSGNLKAAIFPGAYFYLPLFKKGDEEMGGRFDYKPNPPGFIFGGSIGWKVGPGYLFVDGRVEYDGLFWTPAPVDSAFYRNVVRLSVGYEMNFLKKKKKQVDDPSAVWAKVIPVADAEGQEQEQEQEQESTQEQIPSEDETLETSETSETLALTEMSELPEASEPF